MLTELKDITDAAVAAERLLDGIIGEYSIRGQALNVTCSLGIIIFPEHGTDPETLMKNADAAMYSAKQNGRDNFRFFTDEMNAQVVERLTWRTACEWHSTGKNSFLFTNRKWTWPLEGSLGWKHFSAGNTRNWALYHTAQVHTNRGEQRADSAYWRVGAQDCLLSSPETARGRPSCGDDSTVNVSAIQFRQESFCGLIRRVLHETGLAPQCLELELTESLLLANAEVMLSVLEELKAIGVTLAIDDFGTGYSSFSYLRQFRVSKLKIDRSFIRDVAVSPDDAAITAAIISMAKSLHLKVIAEGVEDEAQMSFLRARQCDEIQGYYFSKPLAVDKVADKLRQTLAHNA